MPALQTIVDHLDCELRTREIADFPGSWNGVQIENSGAVTKVAAAVDACEAVIAEAVERGATLLLVHHGLFWSGVQPLVGAARRKVKLALDHDLAIYSAHLPLDFHPTLGNNALLAKALGFKRCTPFLPHKGQTLGLQTSVTLSLEELVRRMEKAVDGPVHACPGGTSQVRRVGLVTGGAGGEIAAAAAEGVDTFITGEGPHWSYTAAEEFGVNVLYGGHYATETFGVKALAANVSKKFRVPWEFIDHPTGL
jgi:dinuclear metal center YbgI/SA1388 family protein